MSYGGSSCCNSTCEDKNACQLLSHRKAAPDASGELPAPVTLALSTVCKHHCRALQPCPRVTARRPRSSLCPRPVPAHPAPGTCPLPRCSFNSTLFPSCSAVCRCLVSLFCLTQVGADSLLGDLMRLVSRAQRKERGTVLRWQVKQWKAAAGLACFAVNDTREAPARLRQILHSGSLRTKTPARGTSMHQEPSAPHPPGAQVHAIPRSLEGSGL